MSVLDRMSSFLAGSSTALGLSGIILYFLLVIAYWKIFEKAGESGWKSIIPIYNVYIEFKISWGSKYFWYSLLFAVGASLFASLNGDFNSVISGVFSFLLFIMLVIESFKLCRSFGHGLLFGLINILFPNIGRLIMGFSSNKYIGPQ